MKRSTLADDIWIGSGLFAAALVIRLIFAAQLAFPPLDDPAFYVQTGRNLAAGRGLVVDVIYNYWVPFTSITHPSHEYWMPITSLVIAVFIRLFGDSLFVAQLPGVFIGALWPVLTYELGRRVMPGAWRWSVLAALLVTFGTVPVYQAVAADSMALYTVLSASALLAGALAIDRVRQSGAADRRAVWMTALSGLACGLSYLTRSHGSLLPMALAVFGAASLWSQRRWLVRLLIVGGAAYFVVVVPWWLRNHAVFGMAQPIPLMALAATMDTSQWYNFSALPTLAGIDWAQAVALRWIAVWQLLGVIALLTLPYGVIGLPVAVIRRETVFRTFTLYAALLFGVAALIIPASGLSGSFYHSAGLFAIWLAVAGMDALRRWYARPVSRPWSIGAVWLIISLMVAQAGVAWPTLIADSHANQTKFATATAWLQSNVPPDQPVITNEAHSLNYASGYLALSLPYAEGMTEVLQLADRYGAHFVVVLGSIGPYPAALDRSVYAIKRFAEGGVSIYELQPE